MLDDASGTVLYTGVDITQADSFNPSVGVLYFSSITIADGVTVTVIGANPLALLSQDTISLAGTISANGGNADPNSGAGGSRSTAGANGSGPGGG